MTDQLKTVSSGKIVLPFDCAGEMAGEAQGVALALIKLVRSLCCVHAGEVTPYTSINGEWDGSPGAHFVGDDAALQITLNEDRICIEWRT